VKEHEHYSTVSGEELKTRNFLRMVPIMLVFSLIGNIVFTSQGITTVTAAKVQAPPAAPLAGPAVYLPVTMFRSPLQTVFGVESHNITTSGGLDLMVQAKTTWVRRNGLLWSAIESTEGVYNWGAASSLEQEMINASQNRLDMILVVRSTPTWAQWNTDTRQGYFCGPILPDKLQAFGDFMYEAVKRYSVAPYNVHYWQIWNEPDVLPSYVPKNSAYGCWGDESDAYYGGTYYAEALKAVYPRIKQANPAAQVIVGGLLLSGIPEIYKQDSFLEGILRHQDSYGNFDGKNYFDGVGFHAYDDQITSGGQSVLGKYYNGGWRTTWDTTGPVLSAKADFLKSVLNSYNASDKYLMSTEAALRLCNDTPDTNFDTTKAYYIAQLYAVSIVNGVKATTWYDLPGGWCNTGLSDPSFSLTPAYQAFKAASTVLRDARFISNIDAYSGVKGFEFVQGTHRLWILWSLDGNNHLISLPDTPLAIIDVFGNPMPINGTSLAVTLTPVYLEWSP
jgi:hypothetical protein